MKEKYKILVIAGGGVFGAIPVDFLTHVGVNDIRNDVDILAGTSIGGIISLYLAHGKSAKQLKVDFTEAVVNIFSKPFWRRFNPFNSAYPASNIEPFLQQHLTEKFGDLKIPVIIPTLNFKDECPKIYDNIVKDTDFEVPSWQIGRATSAAPTYFPPFGDNILLDGGIVENIPLMTVASCIKSKMGVSFDRMHILVIGTGEMIVPQRTLDEVSSYGAISWLKNLLIPFVTKSNEVASHFWARQIGFGYYRYFNPVPISGSMDESDQVTSGKLSKACDPYLDDFKKVWEEFLNS